MRNILKNLAYSFVLLVPLAVFAFVPTKLLDSGQGGELLSNVSQVRPVEYLVLIAIPYLFSMFSAASAQTLRLVPRLGFSVGYATWLRRERALISSSLGLLATLLALSPFYTYRREGAIADVFDHGFVGRWIYEVGVLLLLFLFIEPVWQRFFKITSMRLRWAANLGWRAIYICFVLSVYLSAERYTQKAGDAVIFAIAAVLVALIAPSSRIFVDEGKEGIEDRPIARAKWLIDSQYIEIALASIVILAFAIFPAGTGLWLGSMLVFLLGIGAWTVIFAWIWRIVIGVKHRMAVLVLLTFGCSLLAFYTDRNSTTDAVNFPGVQRLASSSSNGLSAVSVADDYAKWNTERSNTPPIIVLAEGGGIRAAYWTVAGLEMLSLPRVDLIARTYAIVGVSGGALGATAYQANYVAVQHASAADPATFQPIISPAAFAGVISTNAMSGDFIGPWLARVMSTEGLQKLLPWRIAPSKGETLQSAWSDSLTCRFDEFARKVPDTLQETCENVKPILNGPLSNLPRTLNGRPQPRLIFVGTHVETGNRVLFSSIKYDSGTFANTVDMESLAPSSVSMLAAAHASARFPLVSPPGAIFDTNGHASGRVVDGGYIDASGAQTALDLVRAIAVGNKSFHPIVIDLNNDPDDRTSEPRRLSERHIGEFETVAATVGSANKNRRDFIKSQLVNEVCKLGGGYVSLKVDKEKDGTIGLGWTLSQYAAANLTLAMRRESGSFVSKDVSLQTPSGSMALLEAKSAESCRPGARPL